MNTLEVARPTARVLSVRSPAPGPGVCRICRGPARHGAADCWCCRRVCKSLHVLPQDLPPVVPVGLYSPGDAWNTVLRRYKDAPVGAAREHFSEVIVSRLERFWLRHHACVLGATSGFGAYCVVPSSKIRRVSDVPHPLEKVVAKITGLKALRAVRLVPSGGEVCHMQPSSTAFRLADATDLTGLRILVIDDSWVTGARALSAVSSLTDAGAEVAGVLVLGRSVDPFASRHSLSWWEAFVAKGEPTDRCSLEVCQREL